jgi:hypothetical protein
MKKVNRWVGKLILSAVGPILLTQCGIMGPPAAPPHVMVLPISRFNGAEASIGKATQVVVHRSIPSAKLEKAFPQSAGFAHLFSPKAVQLVESTLKQTSLSIDQRRQLVATLGELKYFERRRRMAIQASVPSGPSRFWMLQRATYR